MRYKQMCLYPTMGKFTVSPAAGPTYCQHTQCVSIGWVRGVVRVRVVVCAVTSCPDVLNSSFSRYSVNSRYVPA